MHFLYTENEGNDELGTSQKFPEDLTGTHESKIYH